MRSLHSLLLQQHIHVSEPRYYVGKVPAKPFTHFLCTKGLRIIYTLYSLLGQAYAKKQEQERACSEIEADYRLLAYIGQEAGLPEPPPAYISPPGHPTCVITVADSALALFQASQTYICPAFSEALSCHNRRIINGHHVTPIAHTRIHITGVEYGEFSRSLLPFFPSVYVRKNLIVCLVLQAPRKGDHRSVAPVSGSGNSFRIQKHVSPRGALLRIFEAAGGNMHHCRRSSSMCVHAVGSLPCEAYTSFLANVHTVFVYARETVFRTYFTTYLPESGSNVCFFPFSCPPPEYK